MSTLLQLKKDPERLHQAAQILERENQKLIEENLLLKARIDALQGRDPASTRPMRCAPSAGTRFKCGRVNMKRPTKSMSSSVASWWSSTSGKSTGARVKAALKPRRDRPN